MDHTQPNPNPYGHGHGDAGTVAETELWQMRQLREKQQSQSKGPQFDLVAHLHGQRQFSLKTFGPGPRTKCVLDHIRKELIEIEENQDDVTEWADLLLLAMDGAWRAGHEPEQIAEAIKAKQALNELRKWPD